MFQNNANEDTEQAKQQKIEQQRVLPSFLTDLKALEPLSNQLLIEFQYLQSPYWKFISKSLVNRVEWDMTEELFAGIDKLLAYIDKCIECWDTIMHRMDFPHSFKNIFERKVRMLSQGQDFSADELMFASTLQEELHELMMKLRDDMTLRRLMIQREKHYLLRQENSDKQLFSLLNNELVKSKMKTVDFFTLVWTMSPMLTKIEVDERMYKINQLVRQWRMAISGGR